MPAIRKKYDLSCSKRLFSSATFLYENESPKEKKLEFHCSHPELIIFTEPIVSFNPGERAEVKVLLRPVLKGTKNTVIGYAVDGDSGISDAFSITITYINN